MDGRDLTPLLLGREDAPRLAYVQQAGFADREGIYSARWLLRAPRGPAGTADPESVELYDRVEDPGLRTNVRASNPKVTGRLQSALDAVRRRRRHPAKTEAVSAEEQQQLRELGYVE
jgi:hypothetical protein